MSADHTKYHLAPQVSAVGGPFFKSAMLTLQGFWKKVRECHRVFSSGDPTDTPS